MGLEMFDPNLKCDLGVFLVMEKLEDDTGKVGHEKTSMMLKDRVRVDHNKISRTTTLDRAAKGIATILYDTLLRSRRVWHA